MSKSTVNTSFGVQSMPIIMSINSVAFYALNNSWLSGMCLFFALISWCVLFGEKKK